MISLLSLNSFSNCNLYICTSEFVDRQELINLASHSYGSTINRPVLSKIDKPLSTIVNSHVPTGFKSFHSPSAPPSMGTTTVNCFQDGKNRYYPWIATTFPSKFTLCGGKSWRTAICWHFSRFLFIYSRVEQWLYPCSLPSLLPLVRPNRIDCQQFLVLSVVHRLVRPCSSATFFSRDLINLSAYQATPWVHPTSIVGWWF